MLNTRLTFCILKKNRKNLTAVQFVCIIRWFLLQIMVIIVKIDSSKTLKSNETKDLLALSKTNVQCFQGDTYIYAIKHCNDCYNIMYI